MAVKRVLFQSLGGQNNKLMQQALQEASINATLNHPNVVATYACDLVPVQRAPVAASTPASTQDLQDYHLVMIQVCCPAIMPWGINDQQSPIQ